MRVIEVSMEQLQNERAGEAGVPRENPPTNGIVRHDSHKRKSGVTRPGIEPESPWWEASRLTAQPTWPQNAPSNQCCARWRTLRIGMSSYSFGDKLDSTILCALEHQLADHWLLLQFYTKPGCQALIGERHPDILMASDDDSVLLANVCAAEVRELIKHVLDDSEPTADLQGNKLRIPYCHAWSNTGYSLGTAANQQTSYSRLYKGLWSRHTKKLFVYSPYQCIRMRKQECKLGLGGDDSSVRVVAGMAASQMSQVGSYYSPAVAYGSLSAASMAAAAAAAAQQSISGLSAPAQVSPHTSFTLLWSSARTQGRVKLETPEKTRRPVPSSGTIPLNENPGATLPGIEPVSFWWAASSLTTTLLSSFQDKIGVKHVYTEVDFTIGLQFIRHALDDSEPIADLQKETSNDCHTARLTTRTDIDSCTMLIPDITNKLLVTTRTDIDSCTMLIPDITNTLLVTTRTDIDSCTMLIPDITNKLLVTTRTDIDSCTMLIPDITNTLLVTTRTDIDSCTMLIPDITNTLLVTTRTDIDSCTMLIPDITNKLLVTTRTDIDSCTMLIPDITNKLLVTTRTDIDSCTMLIPDITNTLLVTTRTDIDSCTMLIPDITNTLLVTTRTDIDSCTMLIPDITNTLLVTTRTDIDSCTMLIPDITNKLLVTTRTDIDSCTMLIPDITNKLLVTTRTDIDSCTMLIPDITNTLLVTTRTDIDSCTMLIPDITNTLLVTTRTDIDSCTMLIPDITNTLLVTTRTDIDSCTMLIPDITNKLLIGAGECKGGENGRSPEKTRRPAASSGTIPTCENPRATRAGIEPGFASLGGSATVELRILFSKADFR
ncbi:hypothetical protein PR048_031016 [Dryococelus australis]|uniref:Uncharacterized protein n=1 Tax=Dryococelus australis TaxID=614101 RepID=A0ABQ9G437_9NEOP|nr:hypothetical protein PR048_031016 [Dryococelus australis]